MPLKLYDATGERIVGWQLLYGMTLDEQHWKVLQSELVWSWASDVGLDHSLWQRV